MPNLIENHSPLVKADMSRAEGADVSQSGKSCSALHSHSFVAKT